MGKERETEKNKQIKRELARMRKIFANLPENELKFIEPMLQNAAFMRVVLEELQAQVSEYGCVEEYTNGENQGGRKVSAELSAYNTTVKNYNTVMVKLIERLPKEEKKSAMLSMMERYG